jgi:hypothetical protein
MKRRKSRDIRQLRERQFLIQVLLDVIDDAVDAVEILFSGMAVDHELSMQ